MAEEIKKQKPQKAKVEEKMKEEPKTEAKAEMKNEIKSEEKKIEIKTEKKPEENKKDAKKPEVKKIKKDYALVNGRNISMSPKDSIHVCDMIRGRTIDTALKMLEEVTQYKRVIKMNNREVPHKHGKGVMAGRYPMVVVKEFIKLVKQLKANALHHELELEKCVITLCKADRASKPFRRGGARFKRANVLLKLEKRKEDKKSPNKEAKKEEKK